MDALEIKNELLRLLVDTDDVEVLDTVRKYFKQLKSDKTTQSSQEKLLINQIKSVYPIKDNKRYKALRAKIEGDQISEKEQKELIELTNKFELLDAQRLEYLVQLATLRGQSLSVVLKEY